MSLTTKSAKELKDDIRFMIGQAFDDLGGVPSLVEWAKRPENRGTFYTQIWAKIIPKEVKAQHTGDGGGPIVITWQGPTPAGAIPISLDDDTAEDAELAQSEPV